MSNWGNNNNNNMPNWGNNSNSNSNSNYNHFGDSYRGGYNNNDNGYGNNANNIFPLLAPPPPPSGPMIVNCGELRERHRGAYIEIHGKVNKVRMGRFMELKDSNGVTQLIAPDDSPNMSKRILNMPIDSLITVIGYVQMRPDRLKNKSISTGSIEVRVDTILDVQCNHLNSKNNKFGQKRSYSTMTNSNSDEQLLSRSITSVEYKKSNSENIIKYFENREKTVGELRLNDTNTNLTLVGWLDQRKRGKFVELKDGYGSVQVVLDDSDREMFNTVGLAKENDIVLIKGRVMARPRDKRNDRELTGEIEIVAKEVTILNPDEEYTGVVRVKIPEKPADIERIEIDQEITEIVQSKPEINKFTYRTHNCGELMEEHVGANVVLCGWLEFHRMRKFFTLRDGYGHTQIIIPDGKFDSFKIEDIPYESILKVTGKVLSRPPAMRNPNMLTGSIEIILDECEVLNMAEKNLPIDVKEFNRAKETLRLQHRYIDLRFPDMQQNLRTRSKILMKMREFLINRSGFIEVETPTLFRRTPGGAQEFIVPTRKPEHFYSLVQSPQQFKQMLMAGSIDRYFQIARCYRDESTRPDRQPEFTQLDIELSFTDREKIISMIEELIVYCLPESGINLPFQQIKYDEAMELYGSDKPDIRFDLKLQNLTEILRVKEKLVDGKEDFGAYAIVARTPNGQMTNTLKTVFGKMAKETDTKLYISRVTSKDVNEYSKNGLWKEFPETTLEIAENLKLSQKDILILGYGDRRTVQTLMGRIRLSYIDFLETEKVIPTRKNTPYSFLWVVDFPMFTENRETKELESTHHPFTAPHPEDMAMIVENTNLKNVRSLAYDLVMNGQEIGGGSIRIHDESLQKKVLDDLLKINHSHLKHLLDALKSGCPPHGGIALGIDRFISIICNTKSIRDVIAFPKSLDGKDLLSKAPVKITDAEKKMYFIETVSASTSTPKVVESENKDVVMESVETIVV